MSTSVLLQPFYWKNKKITESDRIQQITPELATEADSLGNTALHMACCYGGEKLTTRIMAALIAANPDAPMTKGWLGGLPLHWAAYSGVATPATKLLLEAYEAAMTVKDQHDKTPLDYAHSEKNMALVEVQNERMHKATDIIRSGVSITANRMRNKAAAEKALEEHKEEDFFAAAKAAAQRELARYKSLGVPPPKEEQVKINKALLSQPSTTTLPTFRRGYADSAKSGRSYRQVTHEVESIFNRYDTDDSGDIDYNELRVAFEELGFKMSAEETALVMKEYDVDDSGGLTLDEFGKLIYDITAKGSQGASKLVHDLDHAVDSVAKAAGDAIYFGKGKSPLSHSYKRTFIYNGQPWATVQHAYSVAKATAIDNPALITATLNAPTASEAHKLVSAHREGGKYTMNVTEEGMWKNADPRKFKYEISLAKFKLHADLADELVATHPKRLICDYPSDKHNHWGVVLTTIRSEIMHAREKARMTLTMTQRNALRDVASF